MQHPAVEHSLAQRFSSCRGGHRCANFLSSERGDDERQPAARDRISKREHNGIGERRDRANHPDDHPGDSDRHSQEVRALLHDACLGAGL